MVKDKKNKVFVVGLDGATFDIINPMIHKGQLPNIARIMNEGSYGSLKSCIPDLSPPAWTSFMTGTHPGKHGIMDFMGQSPGSYRLNFFNASFRREKPVWTLLSETGRRVCIINVPLTYPPDRVNGFMISGMDRPDVETDFIYPSSLRAELDREIGGYVLEKAERNLKKNKIDKYVKNLFYLTQNRLNVARYLMKKDDWDLFVIVFDSTDRVQHNFWKYMDPRHPGYNEKDNKRYGNIIFDTYKDMDCKIGKLTENLPENSTLVILSDHGFGPLYKGVRLNKWLELNSCLSKISIRRTFKKLMGLRCKRKGLEMIAHIDMNKTKVYPLGVYGHLCINLKGRQPQGIVEPGKEYEELRDGLIIKLKSLKDPATDAPVIETVFKREDVYSVFNESTPDILISWAGGYSFIGESVLCLLGIKSQEDSIFTMHRWSGNHRPDGILIIKGKGIKANCEINGAEIVDIAPTVLALLSEGIPNNMDGKVLQEVFTETFLSSNPIKHREVVGTKEEKFYERAYTEEDNAKIGKKLRDLGYIE